MPIPLVLTRLGATQSAPLEMSASGSRPGPAGATFYPDGSCPVVARCASSTAAGCAARSP